METQENKTLRERFSELSDIAFGTPLRKATSMGIGSAAVLLALIQLRPEFREYPFIKEYPIGSRLMLAGTAMGLGSAVSLTADYAGKLFEYASNRLQQAYASYRRR